VLFHGEAVYGAAYSPDGARIATAGGDGTVKIWDAATGALVRELRDEAKTRYAAVATSPDGRLVAAIDTRGDVANLWDAATGERLAEIRNDASEFPALAFSADGRWLATTGGDDVRLFDVHARKRAVTLRGPRVRGLAFDPTGPRLLTGAATGDAAIWAIPSGARIQHLRDVRDPVEVVAYSPDGRLVAAGTRDGAVQVWRAASGELQSQLVPRRSNITAIEFDRTSGLVLAAGADGTVVVADAALGTPSAVLDAQQGVLVAHFDPSSRTRLGQRAVPGRRRHGPHRLPDLARVGRRRVRRPTGDHAFSRARRGRFGVSHPGSLASPRLSELRTRWLRNRAFATEYASAREGGFPVGGFSGSLRGLSA
jgi:WD40 repeat protein